MDNDLAACPSNDSGCQLLCHAQTSLSLVLACVMLSKFVMLLPMLTFQQCAGQVRHASLIAIPSDCAVCTTVCETLHAVCAQMLSSSGMHQHKRGNYSSAAGCACMRLSAWVGLLVLELLSDACADSWSSS